MRNSIVASGSAESLDKACDASTKALKKYLEQHNAEFPEYPIEEKNLFTDERSGEGVKTVFHWKLMCDIVSTIVAKGHEASEETARTKATTALNEYVSSYNARNPQYTIASNLDISTDVTPSDSAVGGYDWVVILHINPRKLKK